MFSLGDIGQVLLWMHSKGENMMLYWRHDLALWECAWIVDGQHHLGRSSFLQGALAQACQSAGFAASAVLKEATRIGNPGHE